MTVLARGEQGPVWQGMSFLVEVALLVVVASFTTGELAISVTLGGDK